MKTENQLTVFKLHRCLHYGLGWKPNEIARIWKVNHN